MTYDTTIHSIVERIMISIGFSADEEAYYV